MGNWKHLKWTMQISRLTALPVFFLFLHTKGTIAYKFQMQAVHDPVLLSYWLYGPGIFLYDRQTLLLPAVKFLYLLQVLFLPYKKVESHLTKIRYLNLAACVTKFG